jgi:hypothetical protein
MNEAGMKPASKVSIVNKIGKLFGYSLSFISNDNQAEIPIVVIVKNSVRDCTNLEECIPKILQCFSDDDVIP